MSNPPNRSPPSFPFPQPFFGNDDPAYPTASHAGYYNEPEQLTDDTGSSYNFSAWDSALPPAGFAPQRNGTLYEPSHAPIHFPLAGFAVQPPQGRGRWPEHFWPPAGFSNGSSPVLSQSTAEPPSPLPPPVFHQANPARDNSSFPPARAPTSRRPPAPPTSGSAGRFHYDDVKPSKHFGRDVKRAVMFMQNAVNCFERWKIELDKQPQGVLDKPQIKDILERVNDLHDRGQTAVRAMTSTASHLSEFAALYSRHLNDASRSGTVAWDDQLLALADRAQGSVCELAAPVATIHERLLQLSAEVDALRQEHRRSWWKTVRKVLALIFSALASFCQVASSMVGNTLVSAGAAPVAFASGYLGQNILQGLKEEDQYKYLVKMLKTNIPTDISVAKVDLDGHTTCLERICRLMNHWRGQNVIQAADAERAATEWKEEAGALAFLSSAGPT